jgi:SAM-dependent methyltransferase
VAHHGARRLTLANILRKSSITRERRSEPSSRRRADSLSVTTPFVLDERIAAFLDRSISRYLAHAPLSLCLRELNRLVAIQWLTAANGGFRGAVLDVGCGDGFWWTFLDRKRCEVYGVDISRSEVDQAREILDHALECDVSRGVAFPGVEFQEIIGNCSLEHVPDIDGALKNLRRSAGPGSRLVMFVPTPTWALQGRVQRVLMRRVPRIAMALAGALNGFFQHWHLYDHKVWSSILELSGWKVRRVHGLGGGRSEFLFRLFMPSGFLAFLAKKATGFYPNRLLRYLPPPLLSPFSALIRWSLSTPVVEPDDRSAYEYMIVAEAE